ncbi:MAG TPA: inorganic diphosphatase [Pyrinomonadaceae bacterium]|nr:inorganic diphosphatase [Pyrinomonadaceae bacterium]
MRFDLPPFDEETEELNVVVETPKRSRNKFDYDERRGLFKLGGVLPAGAFFPFDFGFVPSTVGGDGDPVDVLLLMDEPAFPGCLVAARLVGVIEAEQTERDGERTRNDRLIAVAADSRAHRDVRKLGDLSETLLDEIEHFFVSYNEIKGKKFEPRGRFGPERAREVVEQSARKRGGKKSARKRAGKARSGGKGRERGR